MRLSKADLSRGATELINGAKSQPVSTLRSIQRVMIVGSPGAGKSTLAMQLGSVINLPVTHFDQIQYLPGWTERPRAETNSIALHIHSEGEWIFEGCYSEMYTERMARADLLIWLDLPVWTRFLRVLRRSFAYYGQTRPDMCIGCPQTFNWNTLKFLYCIFHEQKRERNEFLQAYLGSPATLRSVRLTSQVEIEAFVSSITTETWRTEYQGLAVHAADVSKSHGGTLK